MTHVLAIDQGTTSTRALLFDGDARVVARGQEEFAQHFPQPGWVEHDPADLWSTTAATCREAMERAGVRATDIAAIGITNQRETVVLWDRTTGRPVHNAIVWQDRRTAAFCAELREAGHEDGVRARTGLLLDPYFSSTKLAWLLDNVEGVRARAEAGELAFGTVDCWLIWNLTGGAKGVGGTTRHVTDVTNASRTLLMDLAGAQWHEPTIEALGLGAVRGALPEITSNAEVLGEVADGGALHGARLTGCIGDQQSAMVGQRCFAPGGP